MGHGQIYVSAGFLGYLLHKTTGSVDDQINDQNLLRYTHFAGLWIPFCKSLVQNDCGLNFFRRNYSYRSFPIKRHYSFQYKNKKKHQTFLFLSQKQCKSYNCLPQCHTGNTHYRLKRAQSRIANRKVGQIAFQKHIFFN